MTSRREQLGDLKTQPGPPDVEASTEDANTTVIDPPSESQPTAPIPQQIVDAPAPPAPTPRLKTAPYVIFDAVSAKQAAEREKERQAADAKEVAPTRRGHAVESAEPSEPRGPTTIPGPGPKAPGGPTSDKRPEKAAARATESVETNAKEKEDSVESRRVVSATGAFVVGILAVAIVAGASVGAFILSSRPSVPPAATIPQPPSSAVATANTAATSATNDASTNTSSSTTANGAATPVAPATSASNEATSATSPSTTLAANDEKPLPKESGAKPSKQSLDRLIASVKPALTACVKGQPKAMYSVKITFDGVTGKPTDAQTFVPIRGTVAGGCVLGAAFDARINPFAGPTFTAELKFSP